MRGMSSASHLASTSANRASGTGRFRSTWTSRRSQRSLLICCKAFQGGNADAFGNLTIRKIPGAILDRCEWGKDDYSLKIEALPLIEDEPEDEVDEAPSRKPARNQNQPGLFGGGEEAES